MSRLLNTSNQPMLNKYSVLMRILFSNVKRKKILIASPLPSHLWRLPGYLGTQSFLLIWAIASQNGFGPLSPKAWILNQRLKFPPKKLRTSLLDVTVDVSKNKADKWVLQSLSGITAAEPNAGADFPPGLRAFIKQGEDGGGGHQDWSFQSQFRLFSPSWLRPLCVRGWVTPPGLLINIQKAGRHESNNNKSVSEKIPLRPFIN